MSEATLTLDVVSDAICPWCFIGKRRLERAFSLLAGEGRRFTLRWQPFELDPGMPPEGMDRRSYRSAKSGSCERAQRLDERVAMVRREGGITSRHDLTERTPRTFDAHRLIWLAGREGVQDAVVEALFAAYFSRGRDIGDLEVLAAVRRSRARAPARPGLPARCRRRGRGPRHRRGGARGRHRRRADRAP